MLILVILASSKTTKEFAMGLFSLFTGTDINKGVEEWQATENAVLLDVRSASEYQQGHIPGSINTPPRQH